MKLSIATFFIGAIGPVAAKNGLQEGETVLGFTQSQLAGYHRNWNHCTAAFERGGDKCFEQVPGVVPSGLHFITGRLFGFEGCDEATPDTVPVVKCEISVDDYLVRVGKPCLSFIS